MKVMALSQIFYNQYSKGKITLDEILSPKIREEVEYLIEQDKQK